VSKPFPLVVSPQSEDERWMLEALKEAWKAFCTEEVPVGAVLVKEGRVLSRGHNQVEMLKDATAHAEMLCLTSGAAAVENWRLKGCTLYSTLEPCAMCAGALLLSRVDALVWGAPDIRQGANGSWVNLLDKGHPIHEVEIRRGVLESESASMLREFFRQRRAEVGVISGVGGE
jgi:tRNA(adenine34) deaminase